MRRVAIGDGTDNTYGTANPMDVSKITGAGAETAKLFATGAWSTTGVIYRAEVTPGKYEVNLYWAEHYAPVINAAGQGTRIMDVSLNVNDTEENKVLCGWSAASAAGSATGSGDPRAPCTGVTNTAIVRTFQVNVPDGGDGFGILSILLDDLGGVEVADRYQRSLLGAVVLMEKLEDALARQLANS